MLDKFAKVFVLTWVTINLIFLPAALVYGEDIEPSSKTIKKQEEKLGIFGKVDPIYLEQTSEKIALDEAEEFQAKGSSLLLAYIVYLSLLSLIFVFFRKKSKRSQITIFLILALVVAIIFGFLLYASSAISKKKAGKDVDKVYNDFLATYGIKNYVKSCLDQATEEALLLVGRQGGYINKTDFNIILYKRRENKFISFRHENHTGNKTYDVLLAVLERPNGSYGGIDYYNAPLYPYDGSLVKEPIQGSRLMYPFGINDPQDNSKNWQEDILPPLCFSRSGPNMLNFTEYNYSCTTYDKFEPTQRYLEKFIKNRTSVCLNFSFAAEAGYNISRGQLNVTFLFGEEDIVAYLNFPIMISFKGEPPVIKYYDHYSKKQVRLKKIWDLVSELSAADSSDIFFDMVRGAGALETCARYDNTTKSRQTKDRRCLEEGMSVERIADYCPNSSCTDNHSDIYIIVDNKSKLNGKDYVFIFGVENRAPALDYIDESINESAFYFQNMIGQELNYGVNITEKYDKTAYPRSPDNYSIVVDQGDMIEIFPYAKDPDDVDSLKYSYIGWHTNVSLNYRDPVTNKSDHYPLTNSWQGSSYYQQGFIIGNTSISKDANYTTKARDVGYHLVAVNVSDQSGLSDWQDIIIQVRCNTTSTCCNESLDYHFNNNSNCGTNSTCVNPSTCDGEVTDSLCDPITGECTPGTSRNDPGACNRKTCTANQVDCTSYQYGVNTYDCRIRICEGECNRSAACVPQAPCTCSELIHDPTIDAGCNLII